MLLTAMTAATPLSVMAKDKSDNATNSSADAVSAGSHSAPCISWVNPMVKPRLCLLCIHGLGLYSGAYQRFGMRMAARGIATYAIDVRGFGSWMKAQGHEQIDFKGCLDDVKVALQSIRQANPGVPVYLLGESMGGAIALRAASMYPELIEGLISSVPAGDRFQQKKTDLKVALEFLKGRHKQFDIGKQIVGQATQNDKLKKDWEDNPLDRMDLSAEELIQFQKFMNENHDAAKEIKDDPVLFVQGSEDKLVKPEGTWDLFNEVANTDKYFIAVPSEHLIFEEGQDHTQKFDSRVSNIAANWMFMMADKSNGGGKNGNNVLAGSSEPEFESNPQLAAAVAKMVKGQYNDALPLLQDFVKSNPNDPEAHYWLGMAYSKLRKPVLARQEMVKAIALGGGNVRSQQANNYLIANGTDPDGVASAGGSTSTPTVATTTIDPVAKDLTQGVPTVVAFTAAWAEQCQPIDGFFKQAQSMFGNKVKLLKVDVEDKDSAPLLKAFNVGPVPTIVYLEKSGKVSSTMIGRTSFINFAKGISGITQ
jgi:alpha-beta hydrolase superfamily lysophospholipase/thiol-disulfide isomerase/thioredoxin